VAINVCKKARGGKMDIQAERKRVKRQVNLIWHYFKDFKSRMA